ncbi:MAG: cytochrome c peroxidase [Bacteroidota bacterium]
MKGIYVFSLFLLFLIGISCEREELNLKYDVYTPEEYQTISQYLNLPKYPLKYQDNFPSFFTAPHSTHLHDRNLATLGRVIFYDENLSADRTVSCASCHKQELAFADDVAFSEGVSGNVTDRNSIALGSVFSFKQHYGGTSIDRAAFFWDNRATSVREQTKETFANPKEMNMKMAQVVERVKEQPYYIPLFRAAFGNNRSISDAQILNAITEFINSIGSFDSKYDHALEKHFNKHKGFRFEIETNLEGLTHQENVGRRLYNNNCAGCHGKLEKDSGLPTSTARNNGLYLDYEDKGIGAISHRYSDEGKFKVPSLRNVALTAPYMHDGSIATLEEVIDHYSGGIQKHRNLDPSLKNGQQPSRFNFSNTSKQALIAFLNTLTDESFLQQEKYSDPFK